MLFPITAVVCFVFVYSFYRSVQHVSWKYNDSDPQQMTTWVKLT